MRAATVPSSAVAREGRMDAEHFLGPDFKGPRRIVDPAAVRAKLLSILECRSCGRAASNAHHIVQKGSPHFGDDVPANVVSLCGSGTMGCHGALHGNPYTDSAGRRWTADDVKQAIGLALRQEEIDYVVEKLGGFTAALVYLEREYRVRLGHTETGWRTVALLADAR